MLKKDVEITISRSFELAFSYKSKEVNVEHLMLSLLENQDIAEVLSYLSVHIEFLKERLKKHILNNSMELVNLEKNELAMGELFYAVLKRAAYYSIQEENNIDGTVSVFGVLFSILDAKQTHASYSLTEQNVTKTNLRKAINRHYKNKKISFENNNFNSNQKRQISKAKIKHIIRENIHKTEEVEEEENILEKYSENLNEKALAGKIDPLIGRDKELDRIVQTLIRRKKNNPILLGEPGVGKTAIIEGLALSIINKKIPKQMINKTIYSLNIMSMLSGTKYRGDFEKRLETLIQQIKLLDNAIIFIDEIHNIIGAGATIGNSLDASNFIKPILADSNSNFIGATTYKEYKNIFEKDGALTRRFQKIIIEQPSFKDTIKILKEIQPLYEKYHKVKYSSQSLVNMVKKTDLFINDRFLPDKAIDIMDETGAYLNLHNKNNNRIVTDDLVNKVIARIINISEDAVGSDDKEKILKLDQKLKKEIFAQDNAIIEIVNSIKVAKANLKDPIKPIASLLFVGPTGVGKTEVCKILTESLGINLLRFDMSEYIEKHSVARLIGSPPGYIGFEQAGLLTDGISKHPSSLVLFDEIEKAHPDIYNIMLQIMDYGTLTDNNGKIANFKNAIIVITSNTGIAYADRNTTGFTKVDHSVDILQSVNQTFSPEFRNRLTAIVKFKHLDIKTIYKIVNKEITKIQKQLKEQELSIKISKTVCELLAKQGYNKTMGARAIQKLIDNKIKLPLSDLILSSSIKKGQTVKFSSAKKSNEKFKITVE